FFAAAGREQEAVVDLLGEAADVGDQAHVTEDLRQLVVGERGELVEVGEAAPLLALERAVQVGDQDLRALVKADLTPVELGDVVEREEVCDEQVDELDRRAAARLDGARERAPVLGEQHVANFVEV